MNFIEATSDLKGRDFSRKGGEAVFFWLGSGESRELMERTSEVTCREPQLTWHDYLKEEFEFVEGDVIEVGDVVGVKPIGGGEPIAAYHRRVLSIHDGLAHLQGNQTLQTLNNLTLISKGPKVHTFEGVHYVNGSPYPMAYQKMGRVMGSIKERGLVDNGKTYTMTLTEETPNG